PTLSTLFQEQLELHGRLCSLQPTRAAMPMAAGSAEPIAPKSLTTWSVPSMLLAWPVLVLFTRGQARGCRYRTIMRPTFEKVNVEAGASWALLNRRLDGGIPFEWHHHPEFELTLTLNSQGHRLIGDHAGSYEDGDLVLVGPSLPHSWCSHAAIDDRRPH